MKFKDVLAMILMFGGFIIAIVCGVIMVINQFKNPDMTKTRLIIEYSGTVTIGIVSCICGYIGMKILSK